MVFLPKMQNVGLIVKEQQTDSNLRTIYKVTSSCSVKIKDRARQRQTEGLFQIRNLATKCDM